MRTYITNASTTIVFANEKTRFTTITVPRLLLPRYTLVYDLARINSFGCVAIYVYDSFSFTRLDIDIFKQYFSVYENMYLEIYNKDASFHKYVIGSVYRRPSDLLNDLTHHSKTLSNSHAVSKEAYVNGDYDMDLLQLHTKSLVQCTLFIT